MEAVRAALKGVSDAEAAVGNLLAGMGAALLTRRNDALRRPRPRGSCCSRPRAGRAGHRPDGCAGQCQQPPRATCGGTGICRRSPG